MDKPEGMIGDFESCNCQKTGTCCGCGKPEPFQAITYGEKRPAVWHVFCKKCFGHLVKSRSWRKNGGWGFEIPKADLKQFEEIRGENKMNKKIKKENDKMTKKPKELDLAKHISDLNKLKNKKTEKPTDKLDAWDLDFDREGEEEQRTVITEDFLVTEKEIKDFNGLQSLHEEIKQYFNELEVFDKLKKETVKKIESTRQIYYETKGRLEERHGEKQVTLFRTEILKEMP